MVEKKAVKKPEKEQPESQKEAKEKSVSGGSVYLC